MKFINILSVAVLTLASSKALTLPTNYFRDITPKQLLSEINFGYNLGNTMEAIDRTAFNNDDYDLISETRWGNVKTHEGIFTTLIDNKFNIFRIPTTWSGHFDDAPDYKIHDVWMKRVREVVDYAYKNGAYVILDTQHETWNDAYYDNYEKAKEITIKLWEQIAEEFKDYDEHLIFESFNEPRMGGSPVEWKGGNEEGRDVVNKLNNEFVKTVRKTGGYNDKRILMVPLYAAQ
ncbi:glycoside hydrolase family 5 protein, partial [Piromyces sp. E2]